MSCASFRSVRSESAARSRPKSIHRRQSSRLPTGRPIQYGPGSLAKDGLLLCTREFVATPNVVQCLAIRELATVLGDVRSPHDAGWAEGVDNLMQIWP